MNDQDASRAAGSSAPACSALEYRVRLCVDAAGLMLITSLRCAAVECRHHARDYFVCGLKEVVVAQDGLCSRFARRTVEESRLAEEGLEYGVPAMPNTTPHPRAAQGETP